MIRKFCKNDAQSWCSVKTENFIKINSKNYPSEVIELLLKNSSPKKVINESETRLMLVFEEEGRVVGTTALRSTGEITNLFVIPEMHGRGIGKSLLTAAEKKARQKGLPKVFLYSSVFAEEFYKKMGYEMVSEEWEQVNGKPFKTTLMTKNL